MKKIHVTTLGCSKNIVDSELLMGRIEQDGNVITQDPEDADVIILNTCGFIEDAKKESIQAILEALELKKHEPGKKVFVAGCLSQRYPVEIRNEIPEIDALFGTEAFDEIAIKIGGHHAASDHLKRMRKQITPAHYAYLKIAEGCDHGCSFCAIPGIRGKYRSRPLEHIVDEARGLVEKGVKELLLISQDTSYYGVDLYGEQRIIDLLQELDRLDGLNWLRVLYWYPSNFPIGVIELMKSARRLLPYVDLPMQHISANVLRKMKRAGTRSRLMDIFRKLREDLPDAALRTTVLLGHPGETEQDFRELYDYVKEIRFDRLGTFVYSDEDHTAAFDLPDKVDRSVTLHRQQQIMELQRDISLQKNEQLVGKTINVLLDEYDDGSRVFIGRTMKDAPEIDNEVIVRTSGESSVRTGDFVKVCIDDVTEYELYGHISVKQENRLKTTY